jgi:hypothetical protein
MHRTVRENRRALTAAVAVSLLSACSAELKKLRGHDDDHESISTVIVEPAQPSTPPVDSCQGDPAQDGLQCHADGTRTWRFSCQMLDCREVRVFVHYGLDRELGDEARVIVEAFDNRYFDGAPLSVAQVDDFKPRPGENADAKLILGPGEYYVRAYLTTDPEAERVPYELGDMHLVADAPVGVYGVVSGSELAVVPLRVEGAMQSAPNPIDIVLDKLYERPGSEPDTKAKLRLKLQLADGAAVDAGDDLRIELRTSEDLGTDPAQAFLLSTDQLRVTGREGRTEFVTPSLTVGRYIVLVYVDADGNGYYDAGELGQLYKVNGAPQLVDVKQSYTTTLEMTLAADPVR